MGAGSQTQVLWKSSWATSPAPMTSPLYCRSGLCILIPATTVCDHWFLLSVESSSSVIPFSFAFFLNFQTMVFYTFPSLSVCTYSPILISIHTSIRPPTHLASAHLAIRLFRRPHVLDSRRMLRQIILLSKQFIRRVTMLLADRATTEWKGHWGQFKLR